MAFTDQEICVLKATFMQNVIDDEMCLVSYQQTAIISASRHNVQVVSSQIHVRFKGGCCTDCQHLHILKACRWEASVLDLEPLQTFL